MGLLDTCVKLLDNEETVLTEREVERGLAFLDSLVSRAESKELLTDLETVRKQLEGSADKSVRRVLDDLLRTPTPTTTLTKKKKPTKKSRRKS